MTRGGRIILSAILAIPGLYLLYSAASAVYFSPRNDLKTAIQDNRQRLTNIRAAAERHVALREELQTLADRTLGSTREEVESALRARLNRIAEQIEVASFTVSTSAARPSKSPMDRSDLRTNPFRDEIDFTELDGTIAGEGTLEQSIALVDRIEQEPWLKRINSVTVDPKDGGARFDITVRLTTVFIPAYPPSAEGAAALLASTRYDGSGVASLRGMIDANPFRVPASPVVVEEAPPVPVDEGPPPYDYAQWSITMITQSSRGKEVWLFNRESSESRALVPGESLEELQLIEAGDESAEFQLDGERFVVEVGSALVERDAMDE